MSQHESPEAMNSNVSLRHICSFAENQCWLTFMFDVLRHQQSDERLTAVPNQGLRQITAHHGRKHPEHRVEKFGKPCLFFRKDQGLFEFR